MILHKVSTSLTESGWKIHTGPPLKVREVGQSYSGKDFQIKKAALGLIKTHSYNRPTLYCHYTYCLADDVFLMHKKMKEHIAKRVTKDLAKMMEFNDFL